MIYIFSKLTSLRQCLSGAFFILHQEGGKSICRDDAGDAQMILASKVDDGRRESPDVCQLGGICLS